MNRFRTVVFTVLLSCLVVFQGTDVQVEAYAKGTTTLHLDGINYSIPDTWYCLDSMETDTEKYYYNDDTLESGKGTPLLMFLSMNNKGIEDIDVLETRMVAYATKKDKSEVNMTDYILKDISVGNYDGFIYQFDTYNNGEELHTRNLVIDNTDAGKVVIASITVSDSDSQSYLNDINTMSLSVSVDSTDKVDDSSSEEEGTDEKETKKSDNKKKVKQQRHKKKSNSVKKTKTKKKTSSKKSKTNKKRTGKKKSRAVWISATGSKYHSTNHCGRMNASNAIKMTESEAKSQGYSRCKKCW